MNTIELKCENGNKINQTTATTICNIQYSLEYVARVHMLYLYVYFGVLMKAAKIQKKEKLKKLLLLLFEFLHKLCESSVC